MKPPSEPGSAPAIAQIQELKLADIVPDPNNRKEHDKAKLQLFADEIKIDGLLQPIVVRPIGGGKFQLIAGERRWRAFQLLNLQTIPATVREGEVQKTATRKRVAENFHREDLTPIEKARDLEQLFKDGMSQTEVAAFVGAKDQSTISNMMRLLKLPKKVQDWLQDGSLTAAHGKALLRFEGKNKLVEGIAERAIDQGASTKALEKGLPFAEALAEDDIVFAFDWDCSSIAGLPLEYRKDPDFIEAEDSYGDSSLYCLDLDKGEKIQKQVTATREQREHSARSSSSGGSGRPGLSKTELAARKKKLDDNQAARLETSAMGHRVMTRLAEVKDLDEPSVAIIAAEAMSHCGGVEVEEIAKQLGIKLPASFDEHQPNTVTVLKPFDAVRLAAACIAQRETDEAMRWAKPPQEDVLVLSCVSQDKDCAKVVETWKLRVNALVMAGKKAAEIQKEFGIPEYLAVALARITKREQKAAKEAAKKQPKPKAATAVELLAKVAAKKAVPIAVPKAKKKGGRAVITDETRAFVKKMTMAGNTGAEMAKALGISLPSVQTIKKQLGLVRRAA